MTLWTSGAEQPWAGLTVTSLMVAAASRPDAGAARPRRRPHRRAAHDRRAVVSLVTWADRELAEMFAGTAPAPGGVFTHGRFEETDWGPRLRQAAPGPAYASRTAREVGWSRARHRVVEHVEVGEDTDPLGHRRGRWTR